MPLRWSELGSVYPTDYTLLTAQARTEEQGDLWEHILRAKQSLDSMFGL